MTTSSYVTQNDLANIFNEILPAQPLCDLIYNGSFTSGTASLAKSITNYVKLIVVFSDNDGCLYTDTVITGKASTITSMFTAMRVTGVLYSKGMIVQFNDAQMSVSNNNQSAGASTPTSGTYITINQVYGVRTLETEPIAEMADYIVEQGTNANGTYRKWNSGILEQWGYTTIGSNSAASWTYPIPFYSTKIYLTASCHYLSSGTYVAPTISVQPLYTNYANIYARCSTSTVTSAHTVSCHAIGTWK